MKKILAAILAVTLVTCIGAPAFAASDDTCPYVNKSICSASKSLLDTTTED